METSKLSIGKLAFTWWGWIRRRYVYEVGQVLAQDIMFDDILHTLENRSTSL
jgi:hypothetical protein